MDKNDTVRVSSIVANTLKNNDIIYIPELSTELHLFAYRISGKTEANDGSYIISTNNIADFAGFLDRMDFRNQELVMDTSDIIILNDGVAVLQAEPHNSQFVLKRKTKRNKIHIVFHLSLIHKKCC